DLGPRRVRAVRRRRANGRPRLLHDDRRPAGAVPAGRDRRRARRPAGRADGAAAGRWPAGRWRADAQDRAARLPGRSCPDRAFALQGPDLLAAVAGSAMAVYVWGEGPRGGLPAHRSAAAVVAGLRTRQGWAAPDGAQALMRSRPAG